MAKNIKFFKNFKAEAKVLEKYNIKGYKNIIELKVYTIYEDVLSN